MGIFSRPILGQKFAQRAFMVHPIFVPASQRFVAKCSIRFLFAGTVSAAGGRLL